MSKRYGFAIQGYRWAPESFEGFFVVLKPDGKHHRIPIPLNADEKWQLGYTSVCKGGAEGLVLLKKLYRRQKPARHITYGFVDLDDPQMRHIIAQHAVSLDAPLEARLRHYKLVKDTFKAKGGDVSDEEPASPSSRADLSRPVVIHRT